MSKRIVAGLAVALALAFPALAGQVPSPAAQGADEIIRLLGASATVVQGRASAPELNRTRERIDVSTRRS